MTAIEGARRGGFQTRPYGVCWCGYVRRPHLRTAATPMPASSSAAPADASAISSPLDGDASPTLTLDRSSGGTSGSWGSGGGASASSSIMAGSLRVTSAQLGLGLLPRASSSLSADYDGDYGGAAYGPCGAAGDVAGVLVQAQGARQDGAVLQRVRRYVRVAGDRDYGADALAHGERGRRLVTAPTAWSCRTARSPR